MGNGKFGVLPFFLAPKSSKPLDHQRRGYHHAGTPDNELLSLHLRRSAKECLRQRALSSCSDAGGFSSSGMSERRPADTERNYDKWNFSVGGVTR